MLRNGSFLRAGDTGPAVVAPLWGQVRPVAGVFHDNEDAPILAVRDSGERTVEFSIKRSVRATSSV